VNSIEGLDEFRIESQGIGLDELKRIVGLRVEINAYHLEPGSAVPRSGAAGTAEKIQ
jgi:hypothetical protein